MATLEPFVLRIKPALDAYLRAPCREHLERLRHELSQFSFTHMKIFHVQILAPLVLKLEELRGENQDLQTGTIDCLRIVISKLYLNDVKALRTLLVILLMQLRDRDSVATKPHLSEELKLVAVQCIAAALRRASSDVLESFYDKKSEVLLAQILLTLVEFIEKEKYKKLVIESLECLMVVFYVHDEAVFTDVVLRNQVANTVFMFLPKILTVLFKSCLSDEKLGETIKALAIKALGRILCIIYEETNDAVVRCNYDKKEFQKLIDASKHKAEAAPSDDDILYLFSKHSNESLDERLKRLQEHVRSDQWFSATSRKLRVVFMQTSCLRANSSPKIRAEYAEMCCNLLLRCGMHLKENFVYLLENVVSMSEDEDEYIRCLCQQSMQQVQCDIKNESIFDENCELLFDEHLNKLPRIINRCDDTEQYAELLFLKGFLRNLSASRLQLLLSIPKNLEMFCMCLLSAIDLKISRDLLIEEYALREVSEIDVAESAKLHWRQYKHLNSTRCVQIVQEICELLGKMKHLNLIVYDYFAELLGQQNEAMNELLLIMLWVATGTGAALEEKGYQSEMVKLLLNEILLDKHWHLALQPDHTLRLKVNKQTDWFVDRTPGLYESAIEIRTQDCDSDDDDIENDRTNHVTMIDAEFNVLHTCLVLDVLGHCALFYGESFDEQLFRCLHKVLLKVASSNTMVYQAATFCLTSIQRALRFAELSHLIETHTDYITYHLNTILKRSPESRSAVDILTVVLQFSNRDSLPHMESIFATIREECSKSHQTENINAYLRVFNAFVTHLGRWQLMCNKEMNNIPMVIESEEESDLLRNWLDVLQKSPNTEELNSLSESVQPEENKNEKGLEDTDCNADATNDNCDTNPVLPRHIEILKDILNQAMKFVSSSDKSQQILSLECLIAGLPLLKDYEDELLPLVHLIWQPLVEKFRQKDAVVLNRCFMLLNVLATLAKDFILKRSLDDVIPFLKAFLQQAAVHSATEVSMAQTQEYKLQMKLLQDFPNLLQSMQIDGKHLNDIAEVSSLYLSQDQPRELQNQAVQFFHALRLYDGPLAYLVVLKKSHLDAYKANAARVITIFDITTVHAVM